MATVVSHGIVAIAGATLFAPGMLPQRAWAAGAVCAMLPDIDVLGFGVGIEYGDFLGHRGFTHSLVFAAIIAAALCWGRRVPSRGWWFLYLFIATASHGVLDAATDGGLGVAFFSPFANSRWFFPWRPIAVSPIGMAFFSGDGLRAFASEVLWLWMPSAAAAAIGRWMWQRRRSAAASSGNET